VHVVIYPEGVPVEIQVRTEIQNDWAQVMESLADRWGRDIRYGASPLHPNRRAFGPTRRRRIVTRAQAIRDLMKMSRGVDNAEVADVALAEMDGRVPIQLFPPSVMDKMRRVGQDEVLAGELYREVRKAFKRYVTSVGRDSRRSGRVIRRAIPDVASPTMRDIEAACERCDGVVNRDYAHRKRMFRIAHHELRVILRTLGRYVERGVLR